jgi:hypothetical protein
MSISIYNCILNGPAVNSFCFEIDSSLNDNRIRLMSKIIVNTGFILFYDKLNFMNFIESTLIFGPHFINYCIILNKSYYNRINYNRKDTMVAITVSTISAMLLKRLYFEFII